MPTRSPVDLADPDLYAHGDPDAVWADLRENDPVHRTTRADGSSFWSVTRYADAVAVYRDPDVFTSEHGMVLGVDADPAAGRMLVVTDPPRHTALRAVLAGAFTPRVLRGLEARVRELVGDLLGRAVADGEVEFVDAVAARLPVAVVCDLLGLPAADHDWMYHLTSTAFGGGDPGLDTGAVSPADRADAYGEIFDYYARLARERRSRPGDDLVSVLVHGEVDGVGLDVEEVLLNCTNLIIGGNETTRHAASGGLLALAADPGQWRALRERPDLLPLAVEEVLRWTTPGMHVLRTATADTAIAGTPVAAGERVVVWNAAANRDPRVFPEPERFRVDRTPNRHLALGHGPHFCLGANLAKMELRALFGDLVRRVDRVEVTGPVQRVPSPVLRGLRRLPVALRPAGVAA